MAYYYHSELCGFFYFRPNAPTVKQYLPLLKLQSSTKILSTLSRTTLTQTFTNPEATSLDRIRYTFPLYDGVSVVDFVCLIGDRTIQGRVEERQQAKQTYQAAIDRGEAAALLEQATQASDVFSTTVGNIPPKTEIVVKITYLGELKHDAEVNGVRFTIPTFIAPRYGQSTGQSNLDNVNARAMEIVVDVATPDGSTIQKLQSPSHPISVSIGTLSDETNQEPSLSKGSATLTRGSTELDKDFVIQVITKNIGTPKALLESHPTIAGQRALMMTLVPQFSLKPARPEILFCVDRSGSMTGNIPPLRQALKVFLKSLVPGVKFNICSFGSHYEFLWPESKAYGQETLDQATAHVDTIEANMGGTETFRAIEACIERRRTDLPTEIMLLTDGDIWQQEELIKYINVEAEKSKHQIRVFTLGIGSGVSHALVEGVARAGNGFSQSVQDGERFDSKIVRMLKGALTPHISDYSLEVKYQDPSSADEDFEMIEKVSETSSVTVTADESDKITASATGEKPKPISLFSSSEDVEMKDSQHEKDQAKDIYSHLPKIDPPKLLQAPYKIPPLFPFSRSTVYLLISPENSHLRPTSVVLKGTAPEGPVELEIPIQVLDAPGQTIHQLAAKKAVQDLEEGRGWVYDAKDAADGTYIKDKYPSRIDDIVQREAVRLGAQFQVGGKWASFVAVEGNTVLELNEEAQEESEEEEGYALPQFSAARRVANTNINIPITAAKSSSSIGSSLLGGLSSMRMRKASPKMIAHPPPPPAPSKPAAFGAAPMAMYSMAAPRPGGSGASAFVSRASAMPAAPASFAAAPAGAIYADEDMDDGAIEGAGAPRFEAKKASISARKFRLHEGGTRSKSGPAAEPVAPSTPADRARLLIDLQSPFGFWTADSLPWTLLPVSKAAVADAAKKFVAGQTGLDVALVERVFATALVVLFLERMVAEEEGLWDLVVEKARDWVAAEVVVEGGEAEVWDVAGKWVGTS